MSRQHRFQRQHRCAPELPGAAMAYLTSYQALVHRRLIGVPVGQMRRVFRADSTKTKNFFDEAIAAALQQHWSQWAQLIDADDTGR